MKITKGSAYVKKGKYATTIKKHDYTGSQKLPNLFACHYNLSGRGVMSIWAQEL